MGEGKKPDEVSFDDLEDAVVQDPPAPPKPQPAPALGRAATVDDPLTTQLLAEVARRSRTIEVAPDQVEDAYDRAEDDTPPPQLRKRR